MTDDEWKKVISYYKIHHSTEKNICAYKYVDIRESSKLFISFHIQDVVKRDFFLFLQKIKTSHQKRKIKCGLKVIPFGVTHTIYETC